MSYQILSPEQFQSARKAGFSAEQITANELKRKQNTVTAPKQEETQHPFVQQSPTLIEKLGNRASQAGKAITEEKNPFRSTLRFLGATAGGVNDIVNTAVAPILNKTVDTISDVSAVQKFATTKPVSKGLGLIQKAVTKTSQEANKFAQAHPVIAQDVKDFGNIGSMLPIGKGLSVAKNTATPVVNVAKKAVTASPESIVTKRATEIAKIENNYASTRKANIYSKDQGEASRARVAYTDVLTDAVDEDGLIRTKQPGGAVEKYKIQTIDKKEGIVKKLLEQENSLVSLTDVETKLNDAIHKSGLQGADLRNALNNVKQEISGYRLKANKVGDVSLTLLHDAKINATNGINFLTEPNIKIGRKSIASGLKNLIEERSKVNVKEINHELSKYYQDIALLERLDGKRVKGGKLGKYVAEGLGTIIGGAVGTFAGPIGTAGGAIAGKEIAGKLKGDALSRVLGKKTGMDAPESEVLKNAYFRLRNARNSSDINQPTIQAETKVPKVIVKNKN